MHHDVESIRTAILSKYGSLTEPRFDFVQAALDADEYRDLVQDLQSSFEIIEDTDPNDDVSFGLLLRGAHGSFVLRLSMIGRYAAFLRIDQHNRSQLVDAAAAPEERRVLEALRQFQIEPLDQATLSVRIPLELSNTTSATCRLYQALFMDTDVLPWEA